MSTEIIRRLLRDISNKAPDSGSARHYSNVASNDQLDPIRQYKSEILIETQALLNGGADQQVIQDIEALVGELYAKSSNMYSNYEIEQNRRKDTEIRMLLETI